VREDLGPVTAAVQSCHAAIECSSVFSLKDLPRHPAVIILGIKNECKLRRVCNYLVENNIQYVGFQEPDRDDELTAVATQPITGSDRDIFKKYQLLKYQLLGSNNKI